MTDVTGFGLMGHAIEMAEGAGLSVAIESKLVPVLDEAKYYIDKNIVPDATFRNWNAYSPKTFIEQSVDPKISFSVFPDPQTNGGLLLAVASEQVDELMTESEKQGVRLSVIGKFVEEGEKVLVIS